MHHPHRDVDKRFPSSQLQPKNPNTTRSQSNIPGRFSAAFRCERVERAGGNNVPCPGLSPRNSATLPREISILSAQISFAKPEKKAELN